MEETGVEGFEDLVEIIVVTGRSGEAFAASGLADVFGLTRDAFGRDMAAVAVGVGRGNRLFVELGQEDVGNGVVDIVRRGLEKIGEANVKVALAKANSRVEGCEAAKANIEGRHGRTGTEFAVLLLEDRDKRVRSGGFRFGSARLFVRRLRGRRGGEWIEEGGGLRGRRKEVHKFTQWGYAGMLRGGQVLILVCPECMLRKMIL